MGLWAEEATHSSDPQLKAESSRKQLTVSDRNKRRKQDGQQAGTEADV